MYYKILKDGELIVGLSVVVEDADLDEDTLEDITDTVAELHKLTRNPLGMTIKRQGLKLCIIDAIFDSENGIIEYVLTPPLP